MTKKKWKPKVGDWVWIVSIDVHRLYVYKARFGFIVKVANLTYGVKFNDLGIYRTKREAQAAIRAIKKLVRDL